MALMLQKKQPVAKVASSADPVKREFLRWGMLQLG
jgi:hypothetical protein